MDADPVRGGPDGSNAGWDITVTYGAALGWDDWSNQAFPTGYKRDCGDLIDDHENWEYRILEFGSLSGTGDYTGSGLILSHAPSNNYYAFQFGLGANNMNNEYGYSGWFTYNGCSTATASWDPATCSATSIAACRGASSALRHRR